MNADTREGVCIAPAVCALLVRPCNRDTSRHVRSGAMRLHTQRIAHFRSDRAVVPYSSPPTRTGYTMLCSGSVDTGESISQARVRVRRELTAHVDAATASVLECCMHAMSHARWLRKNARARSKNRSALVMYYREALHTLSRYECGPPLDEMSHGVRMTMSDTRFQRFTPAATQRAREQEAVFAFNAAVKKDLDEIGTSTAHIRGADPTCPECKSGNVVHTGSQQLRSSDEPMTEFWKCSDCNKRWRT